jgi:hypothetical protein
MVDVRGPLTAARVTRTPTSDHPHDPVFSLRIGDLGSTAMAIRGGGGWL